MHRRLEHFTVAASLPNLVNLATCNPSDFMTVSKYQCVKFKTKPKTAALFLVIGIVSHSKMFSKRPGHQICVIPSDITWAHSAAVLGCLFKQRKLGLSTFKNGISFSTLKLKDNKFSTKQFSSASMSMGSSSSKSFSTSNNPLPTDIESKSSNNFAQIFAFNP
jgi:hypothetical protein